jgi:uncharacterized protein involved in exopolysaccharide biosynthesis
MGARAVLASLWRRRRLMSGILIAALVLGMVAVMMMPKRYTAEAFIRGEFLALDTVTKDDKSLSTGTINLDLSRVIETGSGVLRSHQLALRVVQQIGLDRLKPVLKIETSSNGIPVKSQEELEDEAAVRLLKDLTVESDPRAYLLTVKYGAEDPQLAVLIANTFAAELLRNARLQKLSQQRAYAEATLSQQLAKFGDKHPRVIDARMKLATTDSLLQQQVAEAPDAILQTAGESVSKAISNPSRPKTAFVIGLLLMLGLAIGSAISLWLERDKWWPAFFRY